MVKKTFLVCLFLAMFVVADCGTTPSPRHTAHSGPIKYACIMVRSDPPGAHIYHKKSGMYLGKTGKNRTVVFSLNGQSGFYTTLVAKKRGYKATEHRFWVKLRYDDINLCAVQGGGGNPPIISLPEHPENFEKVLIVLGSD